MNQEGPSSPVGRHRAGGRWGCSYLLHHLTSGEFVGAGDDCRNRKCETVNYLIVTHQLLLFDNGPVFCLMFLLFAELATDSHNFRTIMTRCRPCPVDMTGLHREVQTFWAAKTSKLASSLKITLVTQVVSQAQHRGLSARKQPIRDLFPTATMSKTQRTASSACLSSWCLFQSQNRSREGGAKKLK